MKNKICFKNRKVLLIILGLVLVVGVLLAAKLFLVERGAVEIEVVHKPSVESPTQGADEQKTNSRQPVYLRLGKVISIEPNESFILQSNRLYSAGTENLTILLNADTKVIEIRVPNFITKNIEKDLQNQGQAIKRVQVNFSNIKVNEEIVVLSPTDIYDLKEFIASRVEYQKYFDPPIK